VRTGDAECGDDELRDALRTALNTKEYADKVAAQLYHEQVRAATHSILSTHKKKTQKDHHHHHHHRHTQYIGTGTVGEQPAEACRGMPQHRDSR